MIDVCFSDSTSGMLRFVRRKLESQEIFGFRFDLDHGYLTGNVIVRQNRMHADNLRLFYSEIGDEVIEESFQSDLENMNEEFRLFREYLERGESIRLWLSNTANDRCCLYWFCDYMSKCLSLSM